MPNPAALATTQDARIPGLPILPLGTDRATLSIPVYDPASDQTYQTELLPGDGAIDSNAVVGGPKLVQYRLSQLYGVPANALTLDRLTPATIVPGTTATVDNPSDTPLSTTLPPKQYVAARTSAGTAGAVVVPAYIGAAAGDTVTIIWQEVAAGGGGSGTVKSVIGVGPDATGDVPLPRLDVYGYSAARRAQVFGLFTSPSQFKAVDVALAGDTSTGIGSRIPDLSNGDTYELVPDPDNPDTSGNPTLTWIRY